MTQTKFKSIFQNFDFFVKNFKNLSNKISNKYLKSIQGDNLLLIT